MRRLNFSRFYNKHFLVLFGNGATSLVGFATAFLLFHSLSIVDIGIWFFVQGLVAICESGRYGFLSTATVKFYAGAEPERAATVLGSVWYLALVLTVVVLIANALALPFLPYIHNPEAVACIKWLGLSYLSSLPSDVVLWRLQANEEYGKMLLIRMINSGSSIIAFSILIVLNKMTLENLFLWNFLTNSIASVAGFFMNMAGIRTLAKRSKECIRELVHFGKYTFGTTICSTMLGNADTFILNFLLGPAAVAIYNLATRLIALIDMPLRAFVTTGMSEMAIAFNSDNMQRLTHILKKYAGMLTIVFIPLAIVSFFFADVAIDLLGSHKYDGTEAANVYRLIMLLALTSPLDRFNGLALDIIHKTNINFYKVLIMLSVKICSGLLFTLLLENIYGIVIANYMMSISAILYGYYQLRKYLDYTIAGTLSTGYIETKLFIQKNLKLIPGLKKMS